MSDGSVRNAPTSVNDITPDGANLGQLTARQVDYARDSSLVSTSSTLSQGSGDVGVPVSPPLFLDAHSPSGGGLSADSLAADAGMPGVATAAAITPQRLDAGGQVPPPSPTPSSPAIAEANQVALSPMVAFQPGEVVDDDEIPAVGASPWLAAAALLPPTDGSGIIRMSETAPMVQRLATTDGVFVGETVPQPIPNGPGMSLLSMGVLAAYLGYKRAAGAGSNG
jgi:hypothetical protein